MSIMKTMQLLLGVVLAFGTLEADAAKEKGKRERGEDPMVQDLKGKQGAEFENAFLAHMIHHHAGGVRMAELALKQAEKAEVKAMAEKMIPVQKEEIGKMTGWLKEWANKTPEDYPMMPEAMKKMERDMAKLNETNGAAFDELFLRLMSLHHRSGVAMAEMVPGKTERVELKDLAAKIAEAQSQEIKEMRRMRKG